MTGSQSFEIFLAVVVQLRARRLVLAALAALGVAAFACLQLAAPAAASSVSYSIQTITPPGPFVAIGGINDSGDVVGTYQYCPSCGPMGGYTINAGFEWSNGHATSLTSPTPGVDSSAANDINDAGTVVGDYAILPDGNEPVAGEWNAGSSTAHRLGAATAHGRSPWPRGAAPRAVSPWALAAREPRASADVPTTPAEASRSCCAACPASSVTAGCTS